MNTLTDEQVRAAHHQRGPACVIAGAGTGKTHTLRERICFLIENLHIEPSRILVATFTNKATADLYNKVLQRLGEATHHIRISTIDSLIWDLAQSAISKKLMPPTRLVGDAHQRILLLESVWATFGKRGFSFGKEWWTENADKAGLVNLIELCVRAELDASGEKKAAWNLVHTRLRELDGAHHLDFVFLLPTIQQLKRTVKLYFDKLQDLGATDYNLLGKSFLRCLKQHRQFRFLKRTKAKKYYLTDNWRSTQPILDAAFSFLRRRVPSLKRVGMLKPLRSSRATHSDQPSAEPVYTATLERALDEVRDLLASRQGLKPCDVAILSRKLDRRTVGEIHDKAERSGLTVQFLSSRADHAMEQVLGSPPSFKPGKALDSLYNHDKVKKVVARSLRKREFDVLRTLRPLATAAEALDTTSRAFTLKEAWPALKKTQDQEVSVTPAVVSRPNAIQVMTIHAAKGLEFPVVLLMKLGKGSEKSFPNPKSLEDSRLVYVGATRARDLLILVHIPKPKPMRTLSAFGNGCISLGPGQGDNLSPGIRSPAILPSSPVVAATHLDYYEQCPLKFAAYHEGRYLPKWLPVPNALEKALGTVILPCGNYHSRWKTG
jgi:DNA helicase-2/ATP-dependent DNA helicase PcrA